MAAAGLAEVTLGPRCLQRVHAGESLAQTRRPEDEPVNRGTTTHPGKKDTMRTNAPKTFLLGDVVAAAFDIAAQYNSDPRAVSILATRTVMRVLRRDHTRPPPGQGAQFLPGASSHNLLALDDVGGKPRPLTIARRGAGR